MFRLQRALWASLSHKEKVISPLAKKLAAEKGVDVSRIMGSGDKGKVLLWDIQAEISPKKFKYRNEPFAHEGTLRKGKLPLELKEGKEQTSTQHAAGKHFARVAEPISAFQNLENVHSAKGELTSLMKESGFNPKFNIPHYHIIIDFDMSAFAAITNQAGVFPFAFNEVAVKFVLRCVGKALEETPEFAVFAQGQKFYRHGGFNLKGIDLSSGLTTHHGRIDYGGKSSRVSSSIFFAMDSPLTEIVMPIEESSNFTLGVGTPMFTPTFGEKAGTTTSVVSTFAFVFDHRVIDGALGARFAAKVGQFVQNPYQLA